MSYLLIFIVCSISNSVPNSTRRTSSPSGSLCILSVPWNIPLEPQVFLANLGQFPSRLVALWLSGELHSHRDGQSLRLFPRLNPRPFSHLGLPLKFGWGQSISICRERMPTRLIIVRVAFGCLQQRVSVLFFPWQEA